MTFYERYSALCQKLGNGRKKIQNKKAKTPVNKGFSGFLPYKKGSIFYSDFSHKNREWAHKNREQ